MVLSDGGGPLGSMAFECNIDARGIRVRRRLGLILVGIGLTIAGLLIFTGSTFGFTWLAPAGFILGGAFSLFEARMGWCAVRALGFRTKI